VPFVDGRPAVDEPWYDAFLTDLAINGGITLAAAAAGVHRSRAHRHTLQNSAFAEEVEHAKAYYRDLIEWESVSLARRKNNPLPFFARLKKELPLNYIDRHAVLGVSVSAEAVVTPAEAQRLLREMLSDARPDVLAMLAGEATTAIEGAGERRRLEP
jgi:hypothetical protein